MAFVSDFHVIQIGQVQILSDDVTLNFTTDISDNGFAVFQFLYRGLNRSRTNVSVNGRRVTQLNPYGFADETAWFQTTFITSPGVVGRSNQITFSGIDLRAEPTGYWVSNLFVMTKQEA